MRKFFGPMGLVSRFTIESQGLKSNMLGDPSARVADVYIPAGHDGQGLEMLPAIETQAGNPIASTAPFIESHDSRRRSGPTLEPLLRPLLNQGS